MAAGPRLCRVPSSCPGCDDLRSRPRVSGHGARRAVRARGRAGGPSGERRRMKKGHLQLPLCHRCSGRTMPSSPDYDCVNLKRTRTPNAITGIPRQPVVFAFALALSRKPWLRGPRPNKEGCPVPLQCLLCWRTRHAAHSWAQLGSSHSVRILEALKQGPWRIRYGSTRQVHALHIYFKFTACAVSCRCGGAWDCGANRR